MFILDYVAKSTKCMTTQNLLKREVNGKIVEKKRESSRMLTIAATQSGSRCMVTVNGYNPERRKAGSGSSCSSRGSQRALTKLTSMGHRGQKESGRIVHQLLH